MWLNLIILSTACLVVGFILGWIIACPRRWDIRISRERAAAREDRTPLPQVTGVP